MAVRAQKKEHVIGMMNIDMSTLKWYNKGSRTPQHMERSYPNEASKKKAAPPAREAFPAKDETKKQGIVHILRPHGRPQHKTPAAASEKGKKMEKLTIKAKLENLNDVTAFVESQLEQMDLPMKTQMQIDLAVEEIFVNIASYAYSPEDGMAIIEVELTEDPRVIITFIDSGKPFDPLAKEDPDIEKSAEDRQVGGLGIFMVKKSMDDVFYEYKDGQNILRIEKRLGAIER